MYIGLVFPIGFVMLLLTFRDMMHTIHFFQIRNLNLTFSPDSYIYNDLGVDTHLGYIPFHNALWPYGHIAILWP